MKLGGFERVGIIDPKELTIIVVGQTPLSPVPRLFLSPPGTVGKLVPFHVVGDIDLIIHIPKHPRVLMLDGCLGSVPAVWAPFVKDFAFIRYAITVRIAICDHIHGICLPNGNPVIKGKDHSGEVEVVDKDGGFIHPSVTIQINQFFNPPVS